MKPSPYQEKIFKHFRFAKARRQNGKSFNLIVSAVAGSGKSTTLRSALQAIVGKHPRDRILVLQFNKHIEVEMIAKIRENAPHLLKNVSVKTTHSAGFGVLRDNKKGGKVEERKYYLLAKDIVEDNSRMLVEAYREEFKSLSAAEQVRMARKKATSQLTEISKYAIMSCQENPSMEMLMAICDTQELEYNPAILHFVPSLLKDAIRSINNKTGVSFEEMIAGPIVTDCVFPTYDWVLVDEVQDLNPAQLQLVLRFAGEHGIIAAFGDPRQSIMAFAGAMSDSTKRYRKGTMARKLPLNICYRCDNSILDLARILVPEIESRDDCPPGIVGIAVNLLEEARAGDAILCRLTAPLVSTCIELIKRRKKAYVKGGALGKAMIDICETVGVDRSMPDFMNSLTVFHEAKIAKALKEKHSQRQQDLLNEKVECIRIIGAFVEADSTDGINKTGKYVSNMIDSLFSDKVPTDSITLSTVHRTKGLEFDRVFIIDFEKMPFQPSWKKEPISKEAYQQEVNLMYVAITRAGKELYFQGTGYSEMTQIINKLHDCADRLRSLKGISKEEVLTPIHEVAIS
jgi:DNA helicase-2/ATP-dependent DNA helicase PcrA